VGRGGEGVWGEGGLKFWIKMACGPRGMSVGSYLIYSNLVFMIPFLGDSHATRVNCMRRFDAHYATFFSCNFKKEQSTSFNAGGRVGCLLCC